MSLDAIGIISAVPAKSVAFYALLGIDLKKGGDHEHYEGSTPSGVRMMLDSVAMMKELVPGFQKPSGSGVVLCFKQGSASAVNDLHARITRAGFESRKEPWDAFWGQRYACVVDPDGNQVDLFAAL